MKIVAMLLSLQCVVLFTYNQRAAAIPTLCQKMDFQRNFVQNEFREIESTRFPLLRRIN